MGEYDFMGEERGPFQGGGAVGSAAADEFVPSVVMADKFGLAKLLNDLADDALRDDVI